MMTKRILASQEFVMGLTWLAPGVVVPNSSKYKILKELQSIKPTPCGYVEISTPAGIQVGAVTEPEDIGYESAAARLAISQSSAVLIEKLSSNEFWLCAVEDGAVFPAGDIVGDKDLITNRLEEIKTDIAGTNIQLYEKQGHFNSSNSQSLGFLELISELEPDKPPVCQSAEQKFLNRKLIAAAAGTLIVIGGFISWSFLPEIFIDDEEEQLMRVQQHTKALNTEKEIIRQALMQNAPVLLATLTDMVNERPLRVKGWRSHTYDWKNNKVIVNWRREHGNFASITPYLSDKNYELNELTGDVTESFDFPAQKLPEDSSLSSLLGKQDQRFELLDILAGLPGNWTLGPAQTMGQLYKYQKSKLTGSCSKLTDAIYVARAFIGLPIRINRIRYSLGGKFNWEIEGELYGKTN